MGSLAIFSLDGDLGHSNRKSDLVFSWLVSKVGSKPYRESKSGLRSFYYSKT